MSASLVILSALETLNRLAVSGDERMADHETAFLVRTTGSYVEGLDTPGRAAKWLTEREWTEASPPAGTTIPGVRYFRAEIPSYHRAFKNACTVAEAIDAGIPLEIRGGHKPSPETGNPLGLRVYTDHSDPVRADEVWLGIGPVEGSDEMIPWFWHPGTPTAPLAGEHEVAAATRIINGEGDEFFEGWLHLGSAGVHFAQPE